MPFELLWQTPARNVFDELTADAEAALRQRAGKGKSSKAEGLFNQVLKCVQLLAENPRHPGLHTHEYNSFQNPFDPKSKVFEAYVQNHTPGAHRVFWCCEPGRNQITIIAITPASVGSTR